MRKMITFDKNLVMEQSMIDRLWHVISIYMVAFWGYFQSIHHLLHTLVFIFLVNMVLKSIWVIKKCNQRRRLKKQIDIMKCLYSFGLWSLSKEFAITACGLCFLAGMFNLLTHDGNSPEWLETVINWLAYFSFLVYTIMTFLRLGAVFPDTTIVAAVKWLLLKINVNKVLPAYISEKIDIEDDSVKELGKLVEDNMDKEG